MQHILSLPLPISLKSFSLRKGSLKVFLVSNVLLLVLFSFLYVLQINSEISERYLIRNYEKILGDTIRAKEVLEINAIQINSLNNITALLGSENFNFEKVETVHHINIVGNQVVYR